MQLAGAVFRHTPAMSAVLAAELTCGYAQRRGVLRTQLRDEGSLECLWL